MHLSIKKISYLLFLAIFSMTFSLNGSPTTNELCYQETLVKTILQNNPEAIQSFQKGKIYLNQENLVLGANGVVLATAAMSYPIPALFSDEKGCYLQTTNAGIPVICARCGFPFEITELVTGCPNCGYAEWPDIP